MMDGLFRIFIPLSVYFLSNTFFDLNALASGSQPNLQSNASAPTDNLPHDSSGITESISSTVVNEIKNAKNSSDSIPLTVKNFGEVLTRNKDALFRSIYVFGGLCLLVVIYFGFRTWRLRRRRNTRRAGARKYLPLQTSSQTHEMEPLEQVNDDEEDEDTLFDTSSSLQQVENQHN